MQIDGQCHCGAIRYRAEVDPGGAFICHCTDCQAMSGSAFRWIVSVQEANFQLLAGNPKIYVKLGESGRESHQYFCETCASPLYALTPGLKPTFFRLRVGTVRQRGELIPQMECWVRSRQEWSSNLPKSRTIEQNPG